MVIIKVMLLFVMLNANRPTDEAYPSTPVVPACTIETEMHWYRVRATAMIIEPFAVIAPFCVP